jgi:uncharacterized protein with HEPN domain
MQDKLDDTIRLRHILDAITEIESYTCNKTFEDFNKDSMMFNASIRQLEVIGEAANKLSEKTLTNYPFIPWAKMIGLKNILIHNYFGVDDKMIWNVIQINLPDLKKHIFTILNNI